MISIVNYGMGNIRSIRNALDYLGVESTVVDSAAGILKSKKLVLPGVGSFAKAMENIRELGLVAALNRSVERHQVPVLGICLGMQILAETGEEDGPSEGLGWIRGSVRRMPAQAGIKLPHVGFNSVCINPGNRSLFQGLVNDSDFYFVHGYALSDCRDEYVSSWTEYGAKFVSSVSQNNIFGTQFHPEKSQGNGLVLLKNFAALDLNGG